MANFNFNKVILGGRLTADPVLQVTPGGIPVTTFPLAVNRNFADKNGEKSADFFNVTAWRQTAEFITRYFRRASGICVVGRLETRTWVDKQTGQKRFATDVTAEEAYFVDAFKESPMGRNHSDVEVDPSSPALAGVDPGAVPAKTPPKAYSTPGARAGIAEQMTEEDLPL